jgi:hypothetical protein
LASHAARPAGGHAEVVRLRQHLPRHWRKMTTVSPVRHASITIKVGHTVRCVSWSAGATSVTPVGCGRAWQLSSRLAHHAALRSTPTSGRATASVLRQRLPWSVRRVSGLSGVLGGDRVTVSVRPFRHCVVWPTSGPARVNAGACGAAPVRETPGTVTTTPTGGTGNTLFGFYPGLESNADSSLTVRQRYDKISAAMGAPKVYRIYFDGLPPASFKGSKADFGVTVVLSFKAPPAQVAAGAYDAQLKSFFASIPTNRMVWWSFYHEPEDNIENGEFTAAQYRAAWAHLVTLAPKRSTLKATLILMRWDLTSKVRHVADYVAPGLDVLAWDAYVRNWSPTISDAYDPAAKVSASYGLGFGIAETSVDSAVANPPARTTVVQDVVNRARADKAQFVTWFETTKTEGDYRLLPYLSAVALWKQLT